MSFVSKMLGAVNSGMKHIFKRRMTLRYPDVKSVIQGDGYKYDPKNGVGLPGYRGRHILYMEKCTGCSLCQMMCQGISKAIEMINLPHKQIPVNKKSIFPQVDYSRCVYCGFCVDACPFEAIFETNEYEVVSYDRESLIFTPEQLAVPPKKRQERIVDFKYGVGDAYHA